MLYIYLISAAIVAYFAIADTLHLGELTLTDALEKLAITTIPVLNTLSVLLAAYLYIKETKLVLWKRR